MLGLTYAEDTQARQFGADAWGALLDSQFSRKSITTLGICELVCRWRLRQVMFKRVVIVVEACLF